MAKGQPISEDLGWAIVQMAPFLDLDRIATFVNVSRRQILQILALHRRTGQVKKAIDRRKLG
jgi:hypothetical protein